MNLPRLNLRTYLASFTKYSFLEDNSKLPVIIAKDLSVDEKAALIKVLKSRKQAIAWKLSDIKGINPEFCSHKILMEEDYEPAVQHQRRVNPKIHDVIKKEVEKLLDAGLIYPISDTPWVSPVHYVPKKGGITVVTNDENKGKLIQKLLLNQKCMGYLVHAYYSISPTRYYKDDSWWSADLKSKAIDDIISIGSFVEAHVLNHYVLVRKIL
ncbi:hypothetical protein Tco_0228079 [Tanacetum coccineum]